MSQIKILLLCTLTIGLASGQCLDGPCWEQCFVNPPATQVRQYAELLQIVNRLRAGRILSTSPITSTTFLFDGTFSSNSEYQLQRYLGAILAHAVPVDSQCNRFFFVNYGPFFWSWFQGIGTVFQPCMTRCQAANLILSSPNLPEVTSSQPLGFSCTFSAFLQSLPFNNMCPAGNRRYGIALMNGNTQQISSSCNYFQQRGSVKVQASSSPLPNFETTPAFGTVVSSAASLAPAARTIYNCIQAKCSCPPLNRQSSISPVEGTLIYAKASNPKEIKRVTRVSSSKVGDTVKRINEAIGGGDDKDNCEKCYGPPCKERAFYYECMAECGFCKDRTDPKMF